MSKEFQAQADAAVQSIPSHIWQRVEQAGWKLRVAEFVVDAQPALVHDRPRGWPVDMTWQNTDAIHFPHERTVVLAEKRRTRSGKTVACSRVAGVLRHEVGHAYDMATGGAYRFRSASPLFRRAYASDTAKMSRQAASQLAYYYQDSDAGRQEAFAEAFGIVLGGGSDVTHRKAFEDSFPAVLQMVRGDLFPQPNGHVQLESTKKGQEDQPRSVLPTRG